MMPQTAFLSNAWAWAYDAYGWTSTLAFVATALLVGTAFGFRLGRLFYKSRTMWLYREEIGAGQKMQLRIFVNADEMPIVECSQLVGGAGQAGPVDLWVPESYDIGSGPIATHKAT